MPENAVGITVAQSSSGNRVVVVTEVADLAAQALDRDHGDSGGDHGQRGMKILGERCR